MELRYYPFLRDWGVLGGAAALPPGAPCAPRLPQRSEAQGPLSQYKT
jgi:hypothetical protein